MYMAGHLLEEHAVSPPPGGWVPTPLTQVIHWLPQSGIKGWPLMAGAGLPNG